MGTGTRRNSKAHAPNFIDRALRVVLTAGFALIKRRARRRQGVHALVLTPERSIVLVKLRYAPGWRLPGGGLNVGESLRVAALRELREEIGMTGHGLVRHGLCDPDPVLIVEDVRYEPPSWSWEVEDIMEAPLDALPAELAPIAARWLSAIGDKL